MELSSRLVSVVFPEFHRVASFMAYTLHPTTFHQSGVFVCVFYPQESRVLPLVYRLCRGHAREAVWSPFPTTQVFDILHGTEKGGQGPVESRDRSTHRARAFQDR